MLRTLPRNEEITLNVPVLLYTLIVSVVVGILFGLMPAVKSWATHPQASLKVGGHGCAGVRIRTQSTFVVVQVALTLVLLVGAGLLFRTVLHLWKVNPGFDAKNIITLKVGVSHSVTKTPASTRVAYRQLIERIRQIPGVEAADFTTAVPLTGHDWARRLLAILGLTRRSPNLCRARHEWAGFLPDQTTFALWGCN